MWRRLVLAGAMALGLTTSAQAQTINITSVGHTAVANLTSAAINIIVKGDDDSSAVCQLFYTTPARYKTLGPAAFDSGTVCVRRARMGAGPTGANPLAFGNMHHGRLLWLSPNTKYYYKIQVLDATGTGDILLADAAIESVTTRAFPVLPTGRKVWVSQYTGNDANGGTGPDDAVATLAQAKTVMAALPYGNPGGGIMVMPGIYRENITLDFGTDSAGVKRYIKGTSVDSCIIDGSSATIASGFAKVGTPLVWVESDTDSIYRAYLPIGDSTCGYWIGWGEYINRKASMTELFTNVNGAPNGWFWTNDTLYMQRQNGLAPDAEGYPLHAGVQRAQNSLIVVAKRNWIIQSLTFRFTGGLHTPASVTSGIDYHAVQLGRASANSNASNTTIDQCKFTGLMGCPAYHTVWSGSGPVRGDSVMFTRNTCDGRGIGRWEYQAAKSRTDENTNMARIIGAQLVMSYNTFRDMSNGPNWGNGGLASFDTLAAHSSEISYNTLEYLSDDALEMDSNDGINLLVYKNTVRYCLNAISLCPVYQGPVWLLFNTIYKPGFQNNGQTFKLGFTNARGHVLIYHNTMVQSTAGWPRVFSAGTIVTHRLRVYNNVVMSKVSGQVYWLQPATDDTTNVFDYNALINPNTTVANFNATFFTLAQLQDVARPDWESNGSLNATTLVDTSEAVQNLRLATGMNTGRRIAGVNTDYLGARYTTAPDVGAFEDGWTGVTGAVRRWLRRHWFN